MLLSQFNNISIKGVSVAVPTKKVEVSSFNEAFGEETVSKFSEMTGIQSYYRAAPLQTAADFGYVAAKDVIEKTGLAKEDIGQLIFVTQKPDYRIPSTSYILHKRLGLSKHCLCLDINLACSGYMFGLQTIFSNLKNSTTKAALLITGDTSYKTLSPKDRTMIMLFGDSGSATIVEKDNSQNKVSFALRSDGNRFKSIITPAGAFRNLDASKEREPWGDGIERSDYDTHMKGMDVFGFSITDVPKLLKEFIKSLEVNPTDFDYYALHQANLYILKQVSRKLKVPMEKILVSIDRFGNNSSNSVPLALCDNLPKEGDKDLKIMMSGFGAGLSWGCCALQISTKSINPIIFTDDFYGKS